MMPHIALWCLEGTTLSNRGQRPRIYDTPLNLCLDGSTPEDERFIYVYRLAIDAKTRMGDDGTA